MSLRTAFAHVVLGLIVVSPAAAASPPAGPGADGDVSVGPVGDERILFDLLNEERRLAGLPPFQWHPVLADLARGHAADVRSVGIASHHSTGDNADFTERLERTDLPVRRWAENVALSDGPLEAHLGLMRSDGHRANILDPKLTDIGIGVALGRDGISLFIVEDFASVVRPLSDHQARQTVSEAIRSVPRAPWRGPASEVAQLTREAERLAERSADLDADRVVGAPMTDHDVTYFYTSLDPEQLPITLEEIAAGAGEYGVGVAWSTTPTRPQGTYFVVVVLRSFV